MNIINISVLSEVVYCMKLTIRISFNYIKDVIKSTKKKINYSLLHDFI